MIKEEFTRKYKSCIIPARTEYAFWYTAPHVVFCVDCVFAKRRGSGKHCDEFVFLDLNRKLTGIYLVERKDTDSIDVQKIKTQLQGGAIFIAKFLSADPALDIYWYDFQPVLVSLGIRPTMLRRLVAETIRLRRQKKHIRHIETHQKLPPITWQRK